MSNAPILYCPLWWAMRPFCLNMPLTACRECGLECSLRSHRQACPQILALNPYQNRASGRQSLRCEWQYLNFAPKSPHRGCYGRSNREKALKCPWRFVRQAHRRQGWQPRRYLSRPKAPTLHVWIPSWQNNLSRQVPTPAIARGASVGRYPPPGWVLSRLAVHRWQG